MDTTDAVILSLSLWIFHIRKGRCLTMISGAQFHVVDESESLILECSFNSETYNMFDYPVIWRKAQLAEEVQINVMGSVNEPFVTNNRLDVTFTSAPPIYVVELSILSVIQEDSGNYTCEVRGPQSIVLGRVTHYLYVRAPVDRVLLLDDSSLEPLTHHSSTSLHLIEHHPSKLRCIALGGYPPPNLEVHVGRRDITAEMTFEHAAMTTGVRGMRRLSYRTERWTNSFVPRAGDNEVLLKCVASVVGLKPVVELVKLDIDYSPKIVCTSTTADVGDRDVTVRCSVVAKPRLSALFWIVDNNGTTLSDGEVYGNCWSHSKTRTDGAVDALLYVRRVQQDNFRSYTLVAENSVAIAATDAEIYKKIKSAAVGRPSTLSGAGGGGASRNHVVNRDAAGKELQGQGYVLLHSNASPSLRTTTTAPSASVTLLGVKLFLTIFSCLLRLNDVTTLSSLYLLTLVLFCVVVVTFGQS